MWKATVEGGTLDTLLENIAKPVHDGLVKFFKEISAIIDKSGLEPATLEYCLQQALSKSRTEFFLLLDRLYCKTHDLDLIWALKILHDLYNDNKLKYSSNKSSAEINALTYCSRINTSNKDANTLNFVHTGVQAFLKKAIDKKFAHSAKVADLRNAELQAILASPNDFTWRLQTWLHDTTNVHLTHPDMCFDGMELDQTNRQALQYYLDGQLEKATTLLQSAKMDSSTSYNSRFHQALLLACLIMYRKVSTIPAEILASQNPALLGSLLNLPCAQPLFNETDQSAWFILSMSDKGKTLLNDLLQKYPTLINVMNPKLLWNLDAKTHASLFYWLCSDLEVEDATEQANKVLRDHPPFGLFTGLTTMGLNIPAKDLRGLQVSRCSGQKC